jgi:hypothetical protein
MNDMIQLINALDSMSEKALIAFIWFLIMDFAPVWAIIGLLTWGIRTVWRHLKSNGSID